MYKNKLIFLEECLSKDLKKKIKKKITILKKNKENFKNANILYTKLKYCLDRNFLSYFKNLDIIVCPTTGLAHIDLDYCKEKKIKIIKLKSNSQFVKKLTSTSELILTFILMGIRQVLNFNRIVKQGYWDRYKFEVMQFKNYTVGIIGMGRIGMQLKDKLSKLNFKILEYDIKNNNKFELKKLLKKSDIISLNIPSDENMNFFSKIYFEMCKKKIIFINTSRGEVVNEKDMFCFFKKNKKAQCYIDVLQNEQRFKNKSNYIKKISNNYSNIFITPHTGGVAKDAIFVAEKTVIDELLNYVK